MKLFYFVGGPKPGKREEFFQRLDHIGGPPPGWKIYPHGTNDGRALHVVAAESEEAVHEHLRQFRDLYEHDAIVEIRETGGSTATPPPS